MNYYKRHLGDYARDTGHLSALEHGIYTLLLDWYYINECPIPEAKAKRIARGNPEETQMVLDEFFTRTPEGWRHARADREIAEYQDKAERNRQSGKLGGRPKKTQTVSSGNPDVTLATSHKPLANKKDKGTSKKQEVPLSTWLDSLNGEPAVAADDPIFDWAKSTGIPANWIAVAWWAFESNYADKPKTYADWRAAFRDHCRRDFLRVWRHDPREDRFVLTTAGQTALKEMEAAQ